MRIIITLYDEHKDGWYKVASGIVEDISLIMQEKIPWINGGRNNFKWENGISMEM